MADVVTMSGDELNLPKILICVLCGYERHNWISPQLMEFLVNTRYSNDYLTVISKAYNFIPAAAARNFIADRAMHIDPKPDWVLMIDNDMGPSDNLLDTIKGAPDDAMIIVPKFHLWDGETTKLCWGMDEDKLQELGDGTQGYKLDKKFYELRICGTGAIFIRPELFEKIGAPWFSYKYDNLGNMVGTEDISFCEKVRNAGYKIYGNSSINVSHFHSTDILQMNKIIHEMKYAQQEQAVANEV